jgi:hypothetical protein
MHDGDDRSSMMRRPDRKEHQVRVFDSFEEENEAEHRRLAAMTHDERMREFAVLQARRWGEDWGRRPIVKRASWERLSW